MSWESTQPVIHIRDLYKSFGELHVLKGVNLDLQRGENVVVLGKSGTGKSVLIKIISGLLKPDKGLVEVLGKEVAKLKEPELRELRQKIGFSFQNAALYDSMTVEENLVFPLVRNIKGIRRKEINEAIDRVLEEVQLPHTRKQMPSELSGGQKKRIGIARTLIMRPEIMLYDEPTAGLDPITSAGINKLIRDVQEHLHTSAIIITHDLTCAKETGDRLEMMIDGEFIHSGTFEEVFASTDKRVRDFYDYNFIT